MKKSLKINAVLNMFRQSLSVIFPLITFPYVSRVLGNIEYGRYTFSTSIVSYFALFSAFGISYFGVRESAGIRNDKKKISEFASEMFSFNLFTTAIAYFVLLILIFINPKINSYALLIMIHSLCMLLTSVGMDWINNVYEDFLYITIRYIIVQILALFSIFVFVKDQNDTAVYCLIIVLASYGGNLINLLYIRKYVHIRLKLHFNIKRYIIPLSVLFVNSLATTIYVNSDITMLGFFMTDKDVGIYSFASKIYNIVKYLINAAVVVAVPRLAFLYNNNKRESYLKHIKIIFSSLLLVIFPVAIGLSGLSRSIIMIAGGKGYLSGDLCLKILSLSLVFALMSSVFTNCILIVGRNEKKCLISTVASASINVVLNFFLIPWIGITGAAITTVLAEFTNFLVQAYFAWKTEKIVISIHLKNVATVVAGGCIVFVFCKAANRIIIGENFGYSVFRVGITFVGSIVIYVLLLFFSKNELFKSLIMKKTCYRPAILTSRRHCIMSHRQG